MNMVTDNDGNLVEATINIKHSELNKIFELAVKIDQIEVPYDSDPLKMANEAIHLMRQYAAEIAALAG